MPRTKTKTRVLGMLDPHRLYTATGLLRHAGIGHESQAAMRKAGVKPIDQGNFRWYRGSDVIAWIEKQAEK
jgi:hypothetical protein